MYWWILLTFVCLACGIKGGNVKRGASCTVDGKTVVDGDTFVLKLSGPCVKYMCKDGNVFPSSYGCERNGKCWPEGDTYDMGCVKRKCSPFNGNFGYIQVSEGCAFKGTCLGVGETYQDGCFVYKCNKGGNPFSTTYSVDLVDWGCSREGKCFPGNTTITEQCRTMVCQSINGMVGFRNTVQGCQFGGSKCLKLGETTVDACRTYKCQLQNVNGVNLYSVDPISVKCQDSNLDCKDPGTTFSFNMGGQIRKNCTCSTEGFNIKYNCF